MLVRCQNLMRPTIAVAALAAMSAGLAIERAAADTPGAAYEVVEVPTGGNYGRGLFRINIATGQVVTAWQSGNFSAIPEPTPLPAGNYHLYMTVSWDGKGAWTLDRVESQTGRSWYLVGGGGSPFAWVEITGP